MRRRVAFFLATIACLSRTLAAVHGAPLTFVLPVPANWQSATHIRLILEGVTLPGNVPLKLRVTSPGQDGQEVFVGSTGIEALGRDKSAPRHLPVLQLDVTRSLRQLLENCAGKKNIELRIQAVDGRNNPIPDLTWSCDKARWEIQDRDKSQ
jgi:hypothetical protein